MYTVYSRTVSRPKQLARKVSGRSRKISIVPTMTAPGGRLTRPIFSPTETPGADSDQRACAPLEHAHNTPLATNQADELQPLSATGPPIRHVQHTDAQMDTGSGPPYGSTDSVTIQDLHLVIQQQQAQMQAMQVAMQERPTRPPLLAQPWRPPTPSVVAPPTPPTESTPAPTDERMRELIMIRHLEYQLNKEREERRLADETRLEHRRQSTASKATAADIARAASACPHNE